MAVLLACLSLGVAAGDWTPMSRQRALEDTRNPLVEKRRLAYARLAEVGTLDDIPVVLAALWDEEDVVRGMAEQVVQGIWMRSDDPVVDPMFQTSLRLMVENEPAEALEMLNEVIALKPDFAEAWNRRGDAYLALGDSDRALADYGRAIELNPYQFGTLGSCGQIWLDRSDYRKAAEFFRRALDLNPNQPEMALVLIELEQKLENDKI
ncbi:MAG TPA: tetratricopeptide repeat protein [Burkholderiales bacterium]